MIDYIVQNPETAATIIAWVIVPLVILAIGVLKTTAWGQANSKVLDEVLDLLDDVEKEDVKKKIKDLAEKLPDQEHDALVDKIRTRDPKAKTPTGKEIIKREIMRSIGAHRRQSPPDSD